MAAAVGTARQAAVVGGGFVGISCALHLQRVGFDVTVFEAGDAVAGTHAASNGNAGTFAAYANTPMAKPGIWKDLPKMLMNPDGAFKLAPTSHLLRMLPWGLGVLDASRELEWRKNALALGTLLRDAQEGYDIAWAHAGVDVDAAMGAHAPTTASRGDAFASRNGYLILHKDATSSGVAATARLRRDGLGPSLRMETLDQSAIKELEPSLSDDVTRGGAHWFPDAWFARDPAALLLAMTDGFRRRGGDVRVGAAEWTVTSLTRAPRGRRVNDRVRVNVARGDGRRDFDVDVAVVAAGAHSAGLAAACGDVVPLDTERGYHVQFNNAASTSVTDSDSDSDSTPPRPLRRPVCSPEGGFILTPMSHGLRAAGLVELGGDRAGATRARFEQLERGTRALLSDAAARELGPRDARRDWLGFRPTLPDSLPVIGPASGMDGVLYAFGHQHVGFTLGGVTGKVVAELAAGRALSVDLSPFRADRFKTKAWWRPFA